MEGAGRRHGVLAHHGVHDEEDVGRARAQLDLLQFVHQRLVHGEAAGRVEEDDVAVLLLGEAHGALADAGGIAGVLGVDGDIEALAQHLELLDGGRAVDVGGHQQGAPLLLFEVAGQLGGAGGLAGALEADHHHRRGALAGEPQRRVHRPHEMGQLGLTDLDEVLFRTRLDLATLGAGTEAHFLAERLGLDALQEGARDLELDVRLQQGEAHVAEGLVDVLFRQLGDPGEAVTGCTESLAKGLQHGSAYL